MRFALLEIKLVLASALTKYKFEKCPETEVNRNFLILIKFFISKFY